MAQTPRGGLYGPPYKGHIGVCAIYSETTVVDCDETTIGVGPLLVLSNIRWLEVRDIWRSGWKTPSRSHDRCRVQTSNPAQDPTRPPRSP